VRKARRPVARTHAPVRKGASTDAARSRGTRVKEDRADSTLASFDDSRGALSKGHLVLIGSGAALAASLGLPAAALAAPTDCNAPYDVYKVPAATLAACGVKTFPLQSQRPTSDGGTAYDYDVHGKTVSFMVPPAGFDPRSASADERAMYGIPHRPSDPGAQAGWDHAAARASFLKPPEFLAVIPAQATSAVKAATGSLNWSGFTDLGGAGAFTQSTGVYTEPTDHGTACSNNSDVSWVGIGGWNSGNLAQDGTGINTPGLGQHQAWKEILPASITPVNLYATPGQSFKATTHWLGNRWQFVLYNEYTGQSQTINVNSSSYDGSSSEFIGERPSVGGNFTNLTNFGHLNWSSAQTNGAPLQNFSHTGVNMYDTSNNLMAGPTTNPGSNGSFTDTWKRCN
jgi:hypothetical protein